MLSVFTKNIKAHFSLILAMIVFLSFGGYHLTRFETTDEHFWKYDRIQKYYNGVHEGLTQNNWKKTRINDKPGVTVALLSGTGLPFAPDPQTHRDHSAEKSTGYMDTDNEITKLYHIYHTEKTLPMNFALRLPILLFNALLVLPLLYYTCRHAFGRSIAHYAIVFIGCNPILIGISQIINPDAVLWGTSALGMISFYALLVTKQKKFLVLCGIATGLALLSKYTANLLFLFYPVIFALHASFAKRSIPYKDYMKVIFLITLIAWSAFALLLPAVIQNPAHFLYGTVYSPVLSAIVDPFISFTHTQDVFFTNDATYKTIPLFMLSLTVFALIIFLLPLCSLWFMKKFSRTSHIFLMIFPLLFVFIASLSFINAWFDTPFFDLTNIKEASREMDQMTFPQLDRYDEPVRTVLALCIQMQNVIFSLHPVVLFVFLFSLFFVILHKKIFSIHPFGLFTFIAIFIFVIGGMASDIFVNVRYAIMLYVPLMVVAGIFIEDLVKYCDHQKPLSCNISVRYVITTLVVTHILSLMIIAPHYFNYENFLLPKKYTVVDSWGYGVYEAASYLNTLPDARNLIIWSDRDGICQFFVGKCIRAATIDLDRTSVDYLVITRRGMLRKPFTAKSTTGTSMDRMHYYEKALHDPQWSLHINNRPENFIKILKTH